MDFTLITYNGRCAIKLNQTKLNFGTKLYVLSFRTGLIYRLFPRCLQVISHKGEHTLYYLQQNLMIIVIIIQRPYLLVK